MNTTKIITLFSLLSLITLSTCKRNEKQNQGYNSQQPEVELATTKPYKFDYDRLTISFKGKEQKNELNGTILLSEKALDVTKENKIERYSIVNFESSSNSLTLYTENNRKDKATWKFFVSNNKTQVEVIMDDVIAKFNIVSGDYASIPFFSIEKDEKNNSVADNKNDQLYNWNKEYKSNKYSYSIKVPETFKKTQGNRPHIDLKFVDDFGSSILVNVSPRQSEEYAITAHDYTKEMLEESFKQATPNVNITFDEKIIVSGEKAFLIEQEGASPNLKTISCYLYHGDQAFLITGTCEKGRFSNYRTLFKNCINSLKL